MIPGISLFVFKNKAAKTGDVNYTPGAFEPLSVLVVRLIEHGAVIVIASPERIMVAPFVDSLQPFIQHSFLQSVQEIGNSSAIGILLLWK